MDYGGLLASPERLVMSYSKAQKLNAVINDPRSAAFYDEMFMHIRCMHMRLSASIQTSHRRTQTVIRCRPHVTVCLPSSCSHRKYAPCRRYDAMLIRKRSINLANVTRQHLPPVHIILCLNKKYCLLESVR